MDADLVPESWRQLLVWNCLHSLLGGNHDVAPSQVLLKWQPVASGCRAPRRKSNPPCRTFPTENATVGARHLCGCAAGRRSAALYQVSERMDPDNLSIDGAFVG
jgi:hypothetical protein